MTKKIPYEPLAPEIVAHVKVLVLMGATAPRIEKAVREDPNFDPQALPILHADSMQHAVELARGAAKPGDIVSLSPASASLTFTPTLKSAAVTTSVLSTSFSNYGITGVVCSFFEKRNRKNFNIIDILY